MKLKENLRICLLALGSRYPSSLVDINETVLGHQYYWSGACVPSRVLGLLQTNAPRLLHTPAQLVIDAQKSEIYLVEWSKEAPAFWIYCGGCTPSQRAKQMLRARTGSEMPVLLT